MDWETLSKTVENLKKEVHSLNIVMGRHITKEDSIPPRVFLTLPDRIDTVIIPQIAYLGEACPYDAKHNAPVEEQKSGKWFFMIKFVDGTFRKFIGPDEQSVREIRHFAEKDINAYYTYLLKR